MIDLLCLKTVWNLVQTESPLYVWCVAFACAAALDVPLAIAAVALKKYHQSLLSKREKNLILILSVSVFIIAFAFSLGFRLLTGDLSFDIGTGSTLVNTLETTSEAESVNPAIIFAALFNGVIPLLTSLSSFVVSYFSSNPVVEKLEKLEKERVGLQSNIIEAEKALVESEDSQTYCVGLIARENDLYNGFIAQLDAEALSMKQTVRVLQMEKLASAENVTSMTMSSEKLAKNAPVSNAPSQELPKFVSELSETEEKKIVEIHNNKVA